MSATIQTDIFSPKRPPRLNNSSLRFCSKKVSTFNFTRISPASNTRTKEQYMHHFHELAIT